MPFAPNPFQLLDQPNKHTSLQGHFASLVDENAELEFERRWDDSRREARYMNFLFTLDSTEMQDRGAKWWEAAHAAYIDYTNNYVTVDSAHRALLGHIQLPANDTSANRQELRKLAKRLRRMLEGRNSVWIESGVDPVVTFGPNPTVAEFYEFGRQQLRVFLHDMNYESSAALIVNEHNVPLVQASAYPRQMNLMSDNPTELEAEPQIELTENTALPENN